MQTQTTCTMDRQCKGGHRINWTDIEGSNGLDKGVERTEDNPWRSFIRIPIGAKWLASAGTDYDDDFIMEVEVSLIEIILWWKWKLDR